MVSRYKNTFFIKNLFYLGFIDVGESNAGNYHYACNFAKMIQYWRQIWNERTNNITDIQFPFGFVQVNLIQNR
jgi:hypothetical protein